MSHILPSILIFFAVSQSTTALQCLVMRPGYGLVNETCPERAVGCRIKVDVDSIQWYEYSKLYDRSQLVCVLTGEYQQISGCEKKASGSVRCWCGSSECNDPERSRNLYKAFEKGGNRAVGEWQATYSYETPGGKTIAEESNEIEIVEVQTTTTKRPSVTKKTSTTTTTTTTTKTTTTRVKATTRRPVKPHITSRKKIITKMTTTVPTTTTAIPAVPTTLHRSNYEETRQLLSEEMKEEDDRMQMILDDEEREMLLEADEDEQKALKEAEMARERAEALKREQERRDEEEMIRLYGKGSKQRRREEEKRRVEEEERMEKEARDQAEKAKKRSSESVDSLYDDVPETDGSPNTVISLTISTIFVYIIFLF